MDVHCHNTRIKAKIAVNRGKFNVTNHRILLEGPELWLFLSGNKTTIDLGKILRSSTLKMPLHRRRLSSFCA